MNPIALLDYAGVAVFAATGALAASRKQLDIIGFLFLASVTGIGGGTFRDLILNVPVFWVDNRDYVLICAVVAVLVFFTAHGSNPATSCCCGSTRWPGRLFGDGRGQRAGHHRLAGGASVTGMLTATFGGILRDLLAGEPSVLLRPEIYVTAAMAGAAVFTLGRHCRPAADCLGTGRLRRRIRRARRRTAFRLGVSLL